MLERSRFICFFVMASESVKAIYERARRKRNSNDRRVFQVLCPWLRVIHPEVFAEFGIFFGHLSEKNPHTKNLTTSDDFRRFCHLGKVGIFFLYFNILIVSSTQLFYIVIL